MTLPHLISGLSSAECVGSADLRSKHVRSASSTPNKKINGADGMEMLCVQGQGMNNPIHIHERCGSLPSDRKSHLSCEMFTCGHPVLTDDNAHPQVLSHGHVRLLEDLNAAQLPLDISAEGPT